MFVNFGKPVIWANYSVSKPVQFYTSFAVQMAHSACRLNLDFNTHTFFFASMCNEKMTKDLFDKRTYFVQKLFNFLKGKRKTKVEHVAKFSLHYLLANLYAKFSCLLPLSLVIFQVYRQSLTSGWHLVICFVEICNEKKPIFKHKVCSN